MKQLFLAAAALLLASACNTADKAETPSAPLKSGVYLDSLDTSVRAQDDFFRHINGQWLANTEIPADRSSYGAFTELFEQNEANLRAIIDEAAAAEAEDGTVTQKIRDLYNSYMDVDAINALGFDPIKGDLARIDGLKSTDEFPKLFADMAREGVSKPLNWFAGQDRKDPTRYMVSFSAGGLGLPDRDYYTNTDERSLKLKEAYKGYIAKLWDLTEQANGEKAADTVIKVETALAEQQWTRVERRNRDKTYNKMDRAGLKKLMGNFDWDALLEAAGAAGETDFNVTTPSYFEGLSKVMEQISIDEWKTYFKFHIISGAASVLSEPFVQANFDFYSKTMRGQQEMRPRWKRGVGTVNGVLGMAVGELYVARHFKPEAKERMAALVENVKAAFGARIDSLEWMSEETKKEARAKLAGFNTKIGYPDKWRDYSGLEIKAGDLAGNLRRASAFNYDYRIGRLGGPVDRDEWGMTPQTVNAYYNSSMNEIVFPAGILQPPFFQLDADDAVNYGAIGAVIGHEISHGFDDQGRKSDGEGVQRDWWTPEDNARFQERADQLAAWYSTFEPVEGANINGKLTLGENIGDLGGLTTAYHAYVRSLDGKESSTLDGYTGEQRLFIGWAQVWRIKFREEALRRRLATGPHSPGEFRVNGVLPNMPEFYDAFGVKEGDAMFRPEGDRVLIW